MVDEHVDHVRASCHGNYERPAAIEAEYDPGNLFRVNCDVKPRD
jgi:hypothetical protein